MSVRFSRNVASKATNTRTVTRIVTGNQLRERECVLLCTIVLVPTIIVGPADNQETADERELTRYQGAT